MGAHNIKTKMAAKAYPEDNIADAAVTFTTHTWDGSTSPAAAEGNKIVADLAALETKVNAILTTLETWGITKSS